MPIASTKSGVTIDGYSASSATLYEDGRGQKLVAPRPIEFGRWSSLKHIPAGETAPLIRYR